jgi:hypothetical protein
LRKEGNCTIADAAGKPSIHRIFSAIFKETANDFCVPYWVNISDETEICAKLKWQDALTIQRLEIIRRNLGKTDAEIAQMPGVGGRRCIFSAENV